MCGRSLGGNLEKKQADEWFHAFLFYFVCLMKSFIHVILGTLIVFLFSACSDNSDENASRGYAPGNIVGKTLELKSSKGTIYLSAEHLNETGVSLNNVTIDYIEYPPSYSYETTENNRAYYYLQVTKKTYITYYKDYHYSNFTFSIDLEFTDESVGIYTGIETNANGDDKNISGTFILK